jgi:putative redox protein
MADVSLSETPKTEATSKPDVVVHGNATGFVQEIASGGHHFRADEPTTVGGTDSAPTPYDYVLAGLGACTSMTVGLFARRKKWPLDDVIVGLRHSRIHANDCADCETKEGMLDRIEIDVELKGALSDEQRAKLMDIASKCPVHRTLRSEMDIKVRPAAAGVTPAASATK